jgi:WhiB family redox-sensing transcriptional regulator
MSSVRDLGELIGELDEGDWVSSAACRHLPPDQIALFFVGAGRSLSRRARQICGGCPVRTDCLKHAYDNEIHAGYFGGVSPSQRSAMPLDEALAMLRAPAGAANVRIAPESAD